MGIHEVEKININQLKSPFRENGQFGPNFVKNCDTLYLMICSTVRIILRHCSIMGQDRKTVVLVSFLKKSPLQAKGQLGPNLAKIYSTLYLMICHRDFS